MTQHAHLSVVRVTAFVVACTAAAACGKGLGSGSSDTTSSNGAVATPADSNVVVRGTVASLTSSNLVIKADTGTVTLALSHALPVYDRQPATLADVKDNTFIGVTTVKQPDGSERATEIHIFPEELRGLGQGSRMMTQGGGNNRMTNGAVSGSRMTNGNASGARMSNGNVASANGSSLVVQYPGGSIQVTVPPNTPVSEIKSTSKQLTAGQQVVVVAKRGTTGSLTASEALLPSR